MRNNVPHTEMRKSHIAVKNFGRKSFLTDSAIFCLRVLQVDPLLELPHCVRMVTVEIPWVDAVGTFWNGEWSWIDRDDECSSRCYDLRRLRWVAVLLDSRKSLLFSWMGLVSNFISARPSVSPGFRNAPQCDLWKCTVWEAGNHFVWEGHWNR